MTSAFPETQVTPRGSPSVHPLNEVASEPRISGSLTFALAAACGAIVANLYFAQPLVGLIGPSIGLHREAASLIVTLTQIGYGVGLILLVPLGDILENRRLVAATLCGTALALLLAAVAPSAAPFLAAAFLIGVSSVAAQMLLPIAAHMAPAASRGRVVGNVMSGLLTGILLARPISSVIAGAAGWRAVFGLSAGLMLILAVAMAGLLPERRPDARFSYRELLRSLWTLVLQTPVLRRRSAYQATLFAAFSLYWTAVPLMLAGPVFGLTQRGIALFALAGAVGAVIAPFAGRIADRGWSRPATGLSIAAVAGAFLLARLGESGSMTALVVAAILLDAGVQSSMVLGQREIYGLAAGARSRLNGLYVATAFAGGAIGSSLTSLSFSRGGWLLVTWLGFGFAAAALLLFLGEFVGRRGR
jgi:predicted MFS family arabinose efflux permease